MTLRGDTVAALATAPGRGGVAVVRVSGGGAFALAEALTGRKPQPGRIAVRRVSRPHSTTCIDECVVLAFRAPRSYTGEDVVEFQCHGGSVTPRRILEACFEAGARLAERGEFTARAFLHGRMDLEAAEGVLELVDAKTDRAADAALARLGGERAKRNRSLYDRAIDLSSSLEYALDVDEDELPPGHVAGLENRIVELEAEIAGALARSREARILHEGARVVLAGAPNAGKSSLLNALLGEDRAIVSAVPGTTRDAIEDWLDIEGWPVCLVDTAGLRGTGDAIEAEGVARAQKLIAAADLVVALDCEIEGALRIHAKCDLDAKDGDAVRSSDLPVSARTGEGLAELRHAIAERLDRKARAIDEPAAGGEREISLLVEALAVLRPVTAALGSSSPDLVLLANAVRACAETIGRLVGAVYSDDLLDALFSRFCVGK